MNNVSDPSTAVTDCLVISGHHYNIEKREGITTLSLDLSASHILGLFGFTDTLTSSV